MTRARDWLVISGAPENSSAPTGWLGHFHEAYEIGDCEDGQQIEGDGWSAIVRRTLTASGRSRPVQSRPALLDAQALLMRAAPVHGDPAAQRFWSVTELLDLGEADEAGKARLEGTPPIFAGIDPRLRGDIVHRLFERWNFGEATPPPIAAVLREFAPEPHVRPKLEEDLAAIIDRFQQSPLLHRIRAAHSIEKETPFVLRVNGALVAGAIDLLLDGSLIVDYKTGPKRPELESRYSQQMHWYGAAVGALRGATPAEAVLYYVDTGEMFRVPLDEAAVEDAVAKFARRLSGPAAYAPA